MSDNPTHFVFFLSIVHSFTAYGKVPCGLDVHNLASMKDSK